MGYSCFKTQQKLKGHWYWYLILQVSKRDLTKGKKMTLAMLKTYHPYQDCLSGDNGEKNVLQKLPDDFLTATSSTFY